MMALVFVGGCVALAGALTFGHALAHYNEMTLPKADEQCVIGAVAIGFGIVIALMGLLV